jgi:hypothetical protein
MDENVLNLFFILQLQQRRHRVGERLGNNTNEYFPTGTVKEVVLPIKKLFIRVWNVK